MAEPRRGIAGVSIAVAFLVLLFQVEAAVLAARIVFELGDRGTYTIGEQPSCGQLRPERCRSDSGTFTSNDGLRSRSGVRLDGSLRSRFAAGDHVRAIDVGDPVRVYSPETRYGFPAAMFLAVPGVALLVIVLASFYLWWHRDRE